MFTQPSTIQFTLPSWLTTFTSNIDVLPTVEERMDFVIAASKQNIKHKTGGPFAAAVFTIESGKLVSLGVNLVTTQNLSLLHAETVAMSIAQRKLNTYDLSSDGRMAYELVISAEPCSMCLGAIPWAGISRIVCAAKDTDIRQIGFDEGAKNSEWQAALTKRHIEVVTDVQRDKARAVLEEYQRSGAVIYNACRSQPIDPHLACK